MRTGPSARLAKSNMAAVAETTLKENEVHEDPTRLVLAAMSSFWKS
jgi:hypothetical protein